MDDFGYYTDLPAERLAEQFSRNWCEDLAREIQFLKFWNFTLTVLMVLIIAWEFSR